MRPVPGWGTSPTRTRRVARSPGTREMRSQVTCSSRGRSVPLTELLPPQVWLEPSMTGLSTAAIEVALVTAMSTPTGFARGGRAQTPATASRQADFSDGDSPRASPADRHAYGGTAIMPP